MAATLQHAKRKENADLHAPAVDVVETESEGGEREEGEGREEIDAVCV